MEYLTQRSCADFTELQAAKTSVPGGGVAALAGVLGAALCAMAVNFTVGKTKVRQCGGGRPLPAG